MTSNDKTGDKLVASVRQTKAGVTKKAAVSKKAPVSKKTPVRKKKVSASPAPAKPVTKPAAKTTSVAADPFQARKRVWPD